jgi:uncharacterized membrane protein YdfJ with MMPL/SSD domain
MIAWMTGASVATWIAATALAGTRFGIDILGGMIGPLVAACATWALTERTYRTAPERLTALMVAGFGAKVVFFGAYVTVMVRGLRLTPMPFAASFTGYFVALLLAEALAMRRLFANDSTG